MSPSPGRRAGLSKGNQRRADARLERMAQLAEFAEKARSTLAPLNGDGWKTGPGMSSKEIAREFCRLHPQPPILGAGDGFAGALRMLIELEDCGFVRRRF